MSDKIKCSECGTLNSPSAMYCVHCGAKWNNVRNESANENFRTSQKHTGRWGVLVIVTVLIIVGGLFGWRTLSRPTEKPTTKGSNSLPGYQTYLALQRMYGMRYQDGKISKPSALIKVLQKHVGVKQDGYFGLIGPCNISSARQSMAR